MDDDVRPPPVDLSHHAPQISAGGVMYRRTGKRIEVCLIAKHQGRVWALPKGRLDEGETSEQTAIREILEETGHRGRIVEKLGDIHYEFLWKDNNTHYHKDVTFYLIELVELNAQKRDQEADSTDWFWIEEAYARITHDNEREMVRRAQRRLDRDLGKKGSAQQ